MRALCIVALAACGSDKPTGPCERGTTFAVHVVDNDAPYMRKLFAHVGNVGREGLATEPKAIELGVRGDIDVWRRESPVTSNGLPRGDGGPAQTDYYLTALARGPLEQYLAAYEPVPDDRMIRFEQVTWDERTFWRSYYLEKQPVFDTTAIADVRVVADPVDERPAVGLFLTARGKDGFARATADAARTGKKLALLVGDTVQSAPVIQGKIDGGKVTLWVPSRADADALAARLACTNASAR